MWTPFCSQTHKWQNSVGCCSGTKNSARPINHFTCRGLLNYSSINAVLDLSFVCQAVAHTYGRRGNRSVPPEVILRMMLLLFLDDIKSERELMRIIPERLDCLWFLDYELDDEIPDHGVLSKARKRWGKEVFLIPFMAKSASFMIL
jgi:Transposase domain (DUF772)